MDNRDLLKLGSGCFVLDDDGEIHGMHPSVRDALKELGIIWQNADGIWRIKSEHNNYVEDFRPDLAICDFCNGRPIAWTAIADTFEMAMAGGPHVSIGDWAVCEPCGQLIKAGDRKGLLARSERAPFAALSGAMLREWHRLFWEHYKGIRPEPKRLFGH